MSYTQVTEEAAKKINRANEDTRALNEIQKNHERFVSSLVLRDHYIVSKENRKDRKRGSVDSSNFA